MGVLSPRRVSVIVPTRDRPAFLRQALASIRAVEGPDLELEIVVGDNGCAEENRRVAEEFNAVYVAAPVPGAAAARNAAMERATGEYWAFLDDDDVWLPAHIRPHLDLLDARPEIDAVFGQIVYVDRDLNPMWAPSPEQFPSEDAALVSMLSGYFPQIGATVVRTAAAKRHGLMDLALLGDQDWDWQLRFAAAGPVGFVRVPSAHCRVRPPSDRYDEVQMMRTRYTHRVFWRFAWPNRRRFGSLLAMLKAHSGALSVYYNYFAEALVERAEGEPKRARRALWCMFRINPRRTLNMVLFGNKIRSAAWRAMQPRFKAETHRTLHS